MSNTMVKDLTKGNVVKLLLSFAFPLFLSKAIWGRTFFGIILNLGRRTFFSVRLFFVFYRKRCKELEEGSIHAIAYE